MSLANIDAHIHLSFIPADRRSSFFEEGQKVGVTSYISGGYNPDDWYEQLQITEDRNQNSKQKVYTCFGLHPWHIRTTDSNTLRTQFAQLEKLVTKADFIGETGIDRFTEISPEKDQEQIQYFTQHIELALRHQKPLVLHIVKAHTDALEILSRYQNPKGILHGFAGAPELAERYYHLGFKISMGPGILSPHGYRKLKETVISLPLHFFTVESDSPQSPDDLTPNPRLLLDVASAVARLKGIAPEKVLEASNENLRELLPVG